MSDEAPSKTSASAVSESSPAENKIVEGDDYYWEGPYMVLTASYLRRRGYCCERGCRNCPYGFLLETK